MFLFLSDPQTFRTKREKHEALATCFCSFQTPRPSGPREKTRGPGLVFFSFQIPRPLSGLRNFAKSFCKRPRPGQDALSQTEAPASCPAGTGGQVTHNKQNAEHTKQNPEQKSRYVSGLGIKTTQNHPSIGIMIFWNFLFVFAWPLNGPSDGRSMRQTHP